MKTVKGIDKITSKVEFKAGIHVCLLSLPYFFKTNIKNIPNDGPYITADKDLVEKWKKLLASIKGIKVGIAWKPNKKSRTLGKRAINLEQLIPLFKIPGYKFISIQKDITEEELLILKAHNVPSLDLKINNFSDTAAIIENLSLVLTIDTSIAHLAGAMGKKTWVMLHKDPDWRWLLDRKDSPWYPSLRLFRQKQNNEWDDIIEDIKQNLTKMTKR